MSAVHDTYVLAQEAAQALIDGSDVEQMPGENPLSALGSDLGEGAFTYEAGMAALVGKALELDRARRGLTEAVAEVLEDRDAHAAAQLVRDTDPDDDLWTNYFGPMLDELEADYSASARDIEES